MTRDQKVQYVIQLYTEGKTFKEISQLTHMSFRDIGVIINRYKNKIERENGQIQVKDDIKSKSKETQAFQLFSEGKDSVYVKIALDLPAEEVESIYLDFLKLKDMHTLVDVYDEMGNHLSSFVELFRIFHARGLGKNEIIEVLRVIVTGELPYLQERVDYLRNHLSRLKHEQKTKEYHLSVLDKRINDLAYREYSKYHPPISNDDSPKPLPYIEDGIIYSNSDTFDKSIRPILNSPKPLPYREDGMYSNSNIEDKSIRLVYSTARQSRRISLNYDPEVMDDIAREIFDASANYLRV
jgi:hypothetical protein